MDRQLRQCEVWPHWPGPSGVDPGEVLGARGDTFSSPVFNGGMAVHKLTSLLKRDSKVDVV